MELINKNKFESKQFVSWYSSQEFRAKYILEFLGLD
jgi:hypothetical protein